MRDAAERIRRERKSPIIERLKWKCCIVIGFTNPDNAQTSYFTLTQRENAPRLSIAEGILKADDSMFIEYAEEGRIVMADVEKRELLRVDGVDVSEVKHNEIVDLTINGDRWEGDVLSKKPCGWGVLYNKDNHRVYEGFRIGGVDVCYGRSYYSDIERIEYEGGICHGMRWGRGVQYDRSGLVVYDGEWLSDEHLDRRVVITETSAVFHNHIEELVVGNGCCNGKEWNCLDLELVPSLKSLFIGNGCFANVEEVRLVGLSELERVVIEKNSFTNSGSCSVPDHGFYLKNCPKLKLLIVGSHSFKDYTVIEIENVDALEVIEMGDLDELSRNFLYASLELKSILIHSE